MQQIIKAYKDAIIYCKSSTKEECQRYLVENNLDLGICFYCKKTNQPIPEFVQGRHFMYPVPSTGINKAEIIDRLVFRYTILKRRYEKSN